ncbi:MAG: class I SAM-dependent methyltransferase [Candidatus Electrothrix sp. AR4]|nr:class I SAM-dependent methyltransferase [Candidatus Electrothrix sp. AR4]
MAQVTHGVRSLLSHPIIYSAFQTLLGAHRCRQNFVSNYVKPFPGMKVLDLGCGPADILAHLPDVKYWGFDISEAYIERAREQFGTAGNFQCKQMQSEDLKYLPQVDLVLALGLLHHLDDATATDVIQLALQALKPGGRLVSIDPCLDPSQNPIARFLISHDRGQDVRDRRGYEALAKKVFSVFRIAVRHHMLRIPYTHCIMECQRNDVTE